MTRPFASVLFRTQGTRTRALGESLESLAAQTDVDFELLVLAHDVAAAARATIEAAIARHPILFERSHLIEVTGGGRSRPLNVGLARARGDYIAFLDDDDFAMPNWIGNVRGGARAAPGLVIRALTNVQEIDPTTGARTTPTVSRHNQRFELLQHLVDNQTPICGFAVPRDRVAESKLDFDEALVVNEDWDFLLRAALHLGVHDTGCVTSVYRSWSSQSNSSTIHPAEDWSEATARLRAKLDASSITLPPGSATTLIRLQQQAQALRETASALHAANERLSAAERQLTFTQSALVDARAESADSMARYLEVIRSASWRALKPLHVIWNHFKRR